MKNKKRMRYKTSSKIVFTLLEVKGYVDSCEVIEKAT